MRYNTRALRLFSSVVARRLFFVLTLLLSFQAFAVQSPVEVLLGVTLDGQVTVEMSNTGSEPVAVLRWETPFESLLSADLFDIHAADPLLPALYQVIPALYQGRVIKRGSPQLDDFIHLKPGESVNTSVSLDRYYEVVRQGTYSVQYKGSLLYRTFDTNDVLSNRSVASLGLDDIKALESLPISTQTLTLFLEPPPVRREARAASFSSCSSGQQAEITTALDAAETITSEARSALAGLTENQRPGSPRYLKWFGQHTEGGFSRVLSTFTETENVIANSEIEFDCSCNEPFFAYVFPVDPFKIYLCPLFWNASLFGTDSRAGTIVHELTHFPEIIGTHDHAYGARDVANLAIVDPTRATFNADSYEYFAENTPAVDIADDSVANDIYADLAVNQTLTANVSLRATDLYRVERATTVVLRSITGDADLSVYSSPERIDSNLMCQSRTTGEIDSCELSPARELFIEVLGYSNADYSLLVTVPNSAPVAQDDLVTTTENTAVTISVLDNDNDVDGNLLSVSISTVPVNGVATSNGSQVSYQPNSGFTGVDNFNYRVDDGNEATALATVTVTVTDSPVEIQGGGEQTEPEETTTIAGPVTPTGGNGGGSMSLWILLLVTLTIVCRWLPVRLLQSGSLRGYTHCH